MIEVLAIQDGHTLQRQPADGMTAALWQVRDMQQGLPANWREVEFQGSRRRGFTWRYRSTLRHSTLTITITREETRRANRGTQGQTS